MDVSYEHHQKYFIVGNNVALLHVNHLKIPKYTIL